MCARALLAVAGLAHAGTAVAQAPSVPGLGLADIVLECRSGNVTVYGCAVRCGHPRSAAPGTGSMPSEYAPGGYPATPGEWTAVSRVEIFASGRPGLPGERMWMLIERDTSASLPRPPAQSGRPPPGPPPPRPIQMLVTYGGDAHCAWEPIARPGVDPYQQPYFVLTRQGRGN